MCFIEEKVKTFESKSSMFFISFEILTQDWGLTINVVNALGLVGFEMSGNTQTETKEQIHETLWFKRKISKPSGSGSGGGLKGVPRRN